MNAVGRLPYDEGATGSPTNRTILGAGDPPRRVQSSSAVDAPAILPLAKT